MFWNILWTILAWIKTLLLWIPSMNRSFIILSSGRSGSSMLRQLLSCHPSIFCHAELLNRCDLLKYNLARDGRIVVSSHYLIKFIKGWLVPESRGSLTPDSSSPMSKLSFVNYLSGNLLNALHGPPVIVLYRKNLLETYVSLQIAWQTGNWYSERKINELSIKIDWEEFRDYIITERNHWRESVHVLSTHLKI